jgi:hypothetical protein
MGTRFDPERPRSRDAARSLAGIAAYDDQV